MGRGVVVKPAIMYRMISVCVHRVLVFRTHKGWRNSRPLSPLSLIGGVATAVALLVRAAAVARHVESGRFHHFSTVHFFFAVKRFSAV